MRCDAIWRDAKLATMVGDGIGAIEDGLIAAGNGKILYAGPESDAPAFEAGEVTHCKGRWITPGLIDCHTHLVHGGDRAREFEMRLQGASYEQIAQAGGGIVSTVSATRAASDETLIADALLRLDALIAEGVTTVEVKSGYGLDTDTEVRMLKIARALGARRNLHVRTTFLGAHAVPPEYRDRADDYIDLVVGEMLPEVARQGLADAVDAYCDTVGFRPAQTRRVFDAARSHGLPVKLHAEQLSNQQGATLAAEYGALSADHLEWLDDDGVTTMAKAGMVATLLPGAFYYLRETRLPPVDALRRAGVPMAIATDCNPGTSPLTSLLLAINMAATLFRLTVEECLIGVTRNAAKALGMQDRAGTLEPGKSCDLAIWDVGHPRELVYRIGANPLHQRIWKGRPA
jgi:imidazolonepropionase